MNAPASAVALAPSVRARLTADRNLEQNLAVLEPASLRERLASVSLPPCEWVFGRDAALTARLPAGWLAGTGLPSRVAERLTAPADCSRASLCLVAPTHGQQVAHLLGRMSRAQALLAVFLDIESLAWSLRCVDVSGALNAGRLHFACGPDVAEAIDEIASRVPGWVIPDRLFRPGDADTDAAINLLERTKAALRRTAERRAVSFGELADRPAEPTGAVVVLASNEFRLWDDAGHALRRACESAIASIIGVDCDDPRQASGLALAQAAAGAGGVVSADVLRDDLRGLVHASLPWTTWITRPRAPAPFCGGRDAVLLAEAAWISRWRDAGWPMERLALAEWPTAEPQALEPAAVPGEPVLLHDLPDFAPPPAVTRFSSQRLLWEQITDELLRRPFALNECPGGPEGFVRSRGEALGARDVPSAAFVAGCVLPAYTRGIARLLCRAGVPLRIFGRGWEREEVAAARWCGPVEGRAHFARLCRESGAIVAASSEPLPAFAGTSTRVIATHRLTEAGLLAALRKSVPHEPQAPVSPLTGQGVASMLGYLWSA